MNSPLSRRLRHPLVLWPITAITLGLGACAVPYPVGPPSVIQAQAPSETRAETARRDYRRRDNESLYEADITSVRAVMGEPEQRCWIERETVAPQRQAPNVPGAIIGGVLGGILGHQVGGGTGKDIATAGGAVAGAFIGSNVGTDRYGNAVATRDVERCTTQPAGREPAYWDVSYRFRGITHHAQMASAPVGRTITVNADGEPRD
jgi:uncharacterized protein YcfJ